MTAAARLLGLVLVGALLARPVQSHSNPPFVLMRDDDAKSAVLPGAARYADVRWRLSGEQRQRLRAGWRFRPGEGSYQVYEGQDAGGRPIGHVVFLTQATIHGPLRIAVGIGRDERVAGAAVVEVSEESLFWVRPLIASELLRAYVGKRALDDFGVPEHAAGGPRKTMQLFYAKLIARLIQCAAALHAVVAHDAETAGTR